VYLFDPSIAPIMYGVKTHREILYKIDTLTFPIGVISKSVTAYAASLSKKRRSLAARLIRPENANRLRDDGPGNQLA